MKHIIKSFIKKITPKLLYRKLSHTLWKWKGMQLRIKAKKIFMLAPGSPNFLGYEALNSLQKKYSYSPEYEYDAYSLEKRGKERAKEILNLIHNESKNIENFLELGCLDGMLSCVLQRMGKATTAIDNTSGFDIRAVREGVKLIQMDAANLQFKNESFDLVFSYNAFEHFAEPELVLQEAIRVVRKGGYVFLAFGPLYMSSMGLHGYRSITVPYCQFLFSKETLCDFTKANELKPIPFSTLNRWSVLDYRKLWNNHRNRLKKIVYRESIDISHLDLIVKYPACFKSKTKCFEDLIVSSITALFKKIK